MCGLLPANEATRTTDFELSVDTRNRLFAGKRNCPCRVHVEVVEEITLHDTALLVPTYSSLVGHDVDPHNNGHDDNDGN